MLSEDEPTDLQFHRDGAQRFHGAVIDDLTDLRAALDHLPIDQPGIRLNDVARLARYLAPRGSIGATAASILGPKSRAVRAVLFDKTATTNWSLAWH